MNFPLSGKALCSFF